MRAFSGVGSEPEGANRDATILILVHHFSGGVPGLEACANRFDDALGFVRVPHSDGLRACLLCRIVISAGKDRVANKDHIGDSDAESLVELLDPIGLMTPAW